MLVVTCLQKVRDPQGKIVSYVLEDNSRNQKIVTPLELKAAIINGDIAVDNLKLTSDGRLIDCKTEETNTTDDILAIQDDYNANNFISCVVKQLRSHGIAAEDEVIGLPTNVKEGKLEKCHCAIIKFNNSKLIGTSGNVLDTNTKISETLANVGMQKYGIAAKLLVKTTQKDGNNKLLDYKILFGTVKEPKENISYYDRAYLATGGTFNQNMKHLLNYRMDRFEASTYAIGYSKDRMNEKVNYTDSGKIIETAALYFVTQLVEILGIPINQLSKAVQIGHALGGVTAGIVGKSLEERTVKAISSNGYNADVVNAHKNHMKAIEGRVDIAAESLGAG